MKLEDKLAIAIDNLKTSKVAEFLKSKEFNDKENYWIISSALGNAAAAGGDLEIVNMLLNHPGIDVNVRDRRERTPLLLAAYHNNPDIVGVLLAHKNIKLYVHDDMKETALILGCNKNSAKSVKLLLDHEISTEDYLNHKDATGMCALSYATRDNYDYIVNMLLANKNIKLDVYDEESQTALIWGCKRNSVESVKLLLNHDSCTDDYVNHKDETGTCALSYALTPDLDDEIAKILIDRPGTELNNFKDLPSILAVLSARFRIACDNGDTSAVAEILRHEQFDVNEPVKNDGTTYLMLAMMKNLPEIVRLLLDIPTIKMDAVDSKEQTALIHACVEGNLECVILFLNDSKCSTEIVNLRDTDNDRNYRLHQNSALEYAVRNANNDIIKLLLDYPDINVNDRAEDEATLLLRAIQNGPDETVNILLAHPGTDLDAVDADETSVLMMACGRDTGVGVLQMLIKDQEWMARNINKISQSNHEETAMLIAASKNYWDMVIILLDQPGVDVNISDKEGHTVLHYAVKENKIEIVRKILAIMNISQDDSTSINIQVYGDSVLKIAAEKGLSDIMKILLQQPGIDINIKDKHAHYGSTLLYSAIKHLENRAEIVEMLLNHPEIDVNMISGDSGTPLFLATHFNYPDIVGMLLADKNIKLDVHEMFHEMSQTALILGCKQNSVESVKLLLNHKACTDDYVNHKDDTGGCALLYGGALLYSGGATGDDIAKMLLNRPGTEVNNVDGCSALHHAMAKNKLDLLKLLLANTTLKLDILDQNGVNVLSEACSTNSIECVNMFTRDKRCSAALINQKGTNVDSALTKAVRGGHFVIVRLLLGYPGSDPNITDSGGLTPLMLAMMQNNNEYDDTNSVKLLLDHKDTKLDVTDGEGRTALQFGLEANYLEGIKLFTADDRCTAEILNNAKMEEEGGTFLTEAVKNWRKDIVKVLVGLPGMDCNAGNPVMFAMIGRNTILSILLTNQSIKFHFDDSLITACMCNYRECVELFTMDSRCTPDILNKKNEFGETALMTAVVYGHLEIVEILAKLPGIDFEAINDDGKSALELAKEKYNDTIAKLLLNKQ